jgi:hypothetical protein
MYLNTVSSSIDRSNCFIPQSLDPPTLFVRPPKFVVIDPERKTPQSMILRCIVDSYPRARITWHHAGSNIAEGAFFHLNNITKHEQQGIYSYRIETDGFQTITNDFIIHIKGKPMIFLEASKEDYRQFECQVYSSTAILVRCYFTSIGR